MDCQRIAIVRLINLEKKRSLIILSAGTELKLSILDYEPDSQKKE